LNEHIFIWHSWFVVSISSFQWWGTNIWGSYLIGKFKLKLVWLYKLALLESKNLIWLGIRNFFKIVDFSAWLGVLWMAVTISLPIILTTNLYLLPLILAIQIHWDLMHFPLLGNYQCTVFSRVTNGWSFIINFTDIFMMSLINLLFQLFLPFHWCHCFKQLLKLKVDDLILLWINTK
jgi:hypothetical protein